MRPVLIGADPMRTEKIWYALYKWQRGSGFRLDDRTLTTVDLAMWDLVGRITGQPVWKLLGGEARPVLPEDGVLDGPEERFAVRTGDLAAGRHVFTIRARDEGGNETVSSVSFEIR